MNVLSICVVPLGARQTEDLIAKITISVGESGKQSDIFNNRGDINWQK